MIPRLLAQLDTPHAVYGTSWSADGARLAFCGGWWYGFAFLGLHDGARTTIWQQPELLAAAGVAAGSNGLIASSVVLVDSGDAAVVSLSSYTWQAHGPAAFELISPPGAEPYLGALVATELEEQLKRSDRASAFTGEQAVGAWPHREHLHSHHRASQWHDSVLRYALQPAIANRLSTSARRSAFQDSRVAVIDELLWVTHRQASVQVQGQLVAEPAALLAWNGEAAPIARVALPTTTTAQPNSVVRNAAGNRLHVGMNDGTVTTWRVDGTDARHLESIAVPAGPNRPPVGVRGVLSLCSLPDERLVTASHGGQLTLWRGDQPTLTWTLPSQLTPRSVAVSPDGRRLAVGAKSKAMQPGAVLIYELP